MSVNNRLAVDWICPQCNSYNFKRRDTCYKCQIRRPADSTDDMNGDSSTDEVCSHPTNTLLVRHMPAGCTEEHLLTALQPRTQLPIRSVRLAAGGGDGRSAGRCYLELNSVLDAMQLNKQLQDEPLLVAGSAVAVSYCRLATAGGGASGGGGGIADTTVDTSRMSIQEMAEYSAKMYAKTPEEYQSYLQYYTDYYKTHGTAGVSMSQNQCDSANAAAAVAQSALQRVLKKTPSSQHQKQDNGSDKQQDKSSSTTAATTTAAVVFDENSTYPPPDTSQFQYDESSGYYFDPSTSLYYDSSSQYFYDGHTQRYLYWDGQLSKYVSAASDHTTAAGDDKKKKEDKHEKVKVAKKIAKDMERWAKTMNSKKEPGRANSTPVAQPVLPVDEAHRTERGARLAADVGYTMFGRRAESALTTPLTVPPASAGITAPASTASSLVAAYGGESGDEEESSSSNNNGDSNSSNNAFVDLQKLACLLCKRAFASEQQLNKHLTKSQLHRTNLAALNNTSSSAGGGGGDNGDVVYRDRAAERRSKFGDAEPPPLSRRQQAAKQAPPPPPRLSAPAQPVTGVGSRMMQAMGWKDGQGLGRDNQGRTDIIQAGRRAASAGLGVSGSNMGGAVVGDNYRDTVKKSMLARYNNVS